MRKDQQNEHRWGIGQTTEVVPRSRRLPAYPLANDETGGRLPLFARNVGDWRKLEDYLTLRMRMMSAAAASTITIATPNTHA
ncbi:hypothetical protein PG2022B_0206 [Bifidobacterium animalis subsp. animalis]|nr:hypothetical protein PG2022B_0206 [Bifidobacterium animalis subsp. animalis]